MTAHPSPYTTDPLRCHQCFACGHVILANSPHVQAIDLRLHPECAKQKLEELR